jgi:predicted metal-dependent hydrolase
MARRKPSQLELLFRSAPAQIASRHQFMLDGKWVDYTLKRSRRRRTITLTIDEDGLRIGAPWRVSQQRVDTLLESHARWIARKLAEWRARRPPPFTWQAGATVMALGEPLTLAVRSAGAATEREGGRLYVCAVVAGDPDTLAQQVIAWLRVTAQDWFEQRAAHFARVLEVRMPAVRLSNARTRWGTCHPDGRVLLNWRLIQAPPALIDYVVVHELAHLREPNHSPRFWRWVASVLPDYQERRRTLRRESHHYLLA